MQTGYWILMDRDMNLRTYNLNLKWVKQKQWEWQRNKKLINLNHNYISSVQINESNKFFEMYYFLNLNWIFFWVLESPILADINPW